MDTIHTCQAGFETCEKDVTHKPATASTQPQKSCERATNELQALALCFKNVSSAQIPDHPTLRPWLPRHSCPLIKQVLRLTQQATYQTPNHLGAIPGANPGSTPSDYHPSNPYRRRSAPSAPRTHFFFFYRSRPIHFSPHPYQRLHRHVRHVRQLRGVRDPCRDHLALGARCSQDPVSASVRSWQPAHHGLVVMKHAAAPCRQCRHPGHLM